MDNLFTLFDPDEYYSREVEPLGEMADVITLQDPVISIQVNPDNSRKGNPYFKVYNTLNLRPGETKVMRLHFLDSGMEYHQDKYLDWVPTKKDINMIISVLSMVHTINKGKIKTNHTNWQEACFLWNRFYGFLNPFDDDDYFDGKFDTQYKDHPSYVPSTTPIPDTWEYNPPKGKNKRR